MATLQIKNLAPELHAALAARARDRGLTMSQYVTRLLERDLTRPTMEDWLEGLMATWAEHADEPRGRLDVVHALDEVRVELEEHTTGVGRSDDPEQPAAVSTVGRPGRRR